MRAPARPSPLILTLLWAVALAIAVAGDSRACRFWGLIGADYPKSLIRDHLQDGTIENLRDLGGQNRDGWGFAIFPAPSDAIPLQRAIFRRGGPRANHPSDPDYGLAVEEMIAIEPAAAVGHVRAGTSGHWGIPNPHPFDNGGFVFGHNGTVPISVLLDLLTSDDPGYLDEHPPDYVEGYIDSELYFLYLQKVWSQTPDLPRAEAIRTAVRRLSELGSWRLNFVLSDGETLYALRCSAYDEYDPVRFFPVDAGGRVGASPYWVVASEVLGSLEAGWGTIPARSLGVLVPGRTPRFLPIDAVAPGQAEGEETPSPIGSWRPNPARAVLEAPVDVPEGGAAVGFEIFDAQGRRLRKDGPIVVDAGARTVRWDGCDANGARVAAGVYYCRLRVGDRQWEQAVTILP